MKRKLALLLAAVMTVTTLPATFLHADTVNGIISNVDAQAKTVLFERTVTSPSAVGTGDIKNNPDVEYYTTGTDLHVKLNSDADAGETIILLLENAQWYFRATKDATATTTSITSVPGFADLAGDRKTVAGGAAIATDLNVPGEKEEAIKAYYVSAGYTADISIVPGKTGAKVAHTTATDISIIYTVTGGSGTTGAGADVLEPGTIEIQQNSTPPDRLIASGDLGTGWFGTTTDPYVTRFTTYDTAKGTGVWNNATKTYVYTRTALSGAAGSGSATKGEIFYQMDMTGDSKQAQVTLLQDAEDGDWVTIPLVIRTTSTNDFNVSITPGSAPVSSGVFRIGSSLEGRTEATTGVITSRDSFNLDPVYLKELKANSIKNGTKFEIKAPSGYEFGDLGSPTNDKNVNVFVQAPLAWNSSATTTSYGLAPIATDAQGTAGTHARNPYYTMEFATRRNGEIDRSTILFQLNTPANTASYDAADKATRGAIDTTDTRGGALFFKNLVLISTDDYDSAVTVDKELKLTFRDTGATKGITDQQLLVAKVADYTVTLTRVKDEIPTLISGRLDGPVTFQGTSSLVYDDDIKDESHKAQTVKFSERIADAWWSERTTKLTLPEEVTIMKAKFDKIEKFDTASGKDSKMKLMQGTNNDGSGEYYNTRKRAANGNVTVKDNTLTLNTLYVQATEKASFELSLWLSIAATFEGEIALKLDGSAIRDVESNKDVSVVIAKAVVPVKISTKVSEVKIGYQYFSVADFDIIENIAGGFLQGEEAYVTITDGISVDMDIAKGFTATVTEGDLKIKDITVGTVLKMYNSKNTNNAAGTGGQIEFLIDRESTKPSTVSFKNVQVKVNRSVPYSNESSTLDRGIDIYVWGPAVAANYYYLDYVYTSTNDTKAVNSNDTFTNVAGISTKYINVVTLVDNKASDYANVVKVTIGNPVVAVNTDEFTMPVAAYVSTKSNSTMVPVRFVANALGLPEESVKWDAVNSTVTVDTGNNRIVQFQVGNTNYLVNGVSVPMVSPDGLAVACEVSEERAFVPFRALGEAFGINVGWDAATTTATYNAPIVK